MDAAASFNQDGNASIERSGMSAHAGHVILSLAYRYGHLMLAVLSQVSGW
ncbi:hypothetical protein [Teredinibacter turnerae]|nr:hypothetical protein [Teredinibacter turnerae]